MSKKKVSPDKEMNHMAQMPKPDEDYKAQSDFHTLMGAAEIHADPERHAKAMKHAKGQMKKIKSLADLHQVADAKTGASLNDSDGDE